MPSRPKSFAFAAFAAVLGCLLPAAGPSLASGAMSGGGGLGVPDMPEISDVICLSGCAKVREVSVGGSVQITGTQMDAVKYVAFRSNGKNIRVEPDAVTSTRAEATVPEGAVTGRIRVVSSSGSPSEPSKQVLTIGNRTFARSGKLTITDAATTPRRAYQYGLRRPVLRFVVNSPSPKVDLRVDIVNGRGDVVRSRFLSDVPTGTTRRVGWAGLVGGGKPAPNGAYRFVVRGNDGTAATLSRRLKRERRKAVRASRAKRVNRANRARRAKAADPFGFRMYGYVFPLRAPHTYGDGIGAARSGHTHQGQDVLAKCGSPLVAARAGVVYYNAYDGGAGNYLVINIKRGGGKSHVYMHMPRRSPLKVGTHVKTGQRIGWVGSTGSSSACHLHFEVWSGPGWYQGGTFLNPTPFLRAWDRYS